MRTELGYLILILLLVALAAASFGARAWSSRRERSFRYEFGRRDERKR
ncbi:hypothetical protein ACVWZA_002519 [Sphingomonas sp. UYAg733]